MTRPQRWLDAARSPWDLAQFDLVRTARSRALKKFSGVFANLLRAPEWRPVRWGAALLVVVNVLGLNVWAWRESANLATTRAAIQNTLTQTFPGVKVVVDAPLQMQREVAGLRQASGAVSSADLEAMLTAIGASAPPEMRIASIDFAAGELRIKGLAVSPQEAGNLPAALKAKGVTPGLAVVLVGDNPASQVYVRNKVKACEDNGLYSVLDKHPSNLSEADLLARVDALNNDPAIHGILVQLPLPAHIDAQKVIEAIAPAKDVDGFHVASAGALMVGQPGFWPCTPYGCMKMLESIDCDLRGKHAVVIGRSNIVGKPMALMLLQKNATVTICHSATADLKAMTLQADVIVAAVGKHNVLTADMVKPGATVLDVGINSVDGKLRGDVAAGVWEVAANVAERIIVVAVAPTISPVSGSAPIVATPPYGAREAKGQ
jgi:methylenetetrahydrofolate dehydrogenase (NADP+)/methenyltetrahydrofolate cyclohydrolase